MSPNGITDPRTKVHQILGVSGDWPPLALPKFVELRQKVCEISVVEKYCSRKSRPKLLYIHKQRTDQIDLKTVIRISWMLMKNACVTLACRSPKHFKLELECGPMPNVMAAQPNIGGALCESSVIPFLVPRRKVWQTPTVRVPCSIALPI